MLKLYCLLVKQFKMEHYNVLKNALWIFLFLCFKSYEVLLLKHKYFNAFKI